MSCAGVQALNPLCQTGDLLRSQSENAANGAFTSMSDQFGQAAMSATTWLWAEMDKATTLDLSSPDLVRELGATSAIAGVLCLGLFLLQLTTAALRREPGALARALKGLIISLVGSAGAIACTRVLLGAVDALSDGVVRYTMGTNIRGLGQKMSFTQLASVQNPAAAVLLAVIVLCAVVVVWVAMMVRKMTLLIAAVLAPLAFAGATADITRSWVRKWIEFVAAMVASKLLLVVIFGIGVSVLNGGGTAGSSTTQGVTQLAVGSLILLLGGFAPWMAIRMFHFVGEGLNAAARRSCPGSLRGKGRHLGPPEGQLGPLAGAVADGRTGGDRVDAEPPERRADLVVRQPALTEPLNLLRVGHTRRRRTEPACRQPWRAHRTACCHRVSQQSGPSAEIARAGSVAGCRTDSDLATATAEAARSAAGVTTP